MFWSETTGCRYHRGHLEPACNWEMTSTACLSFLICKMWIIIVLSQRGLLRIKLNDTCLSLVLGLANDQWVLLLSIVIIIFNNSMQMPTLIYWHVVQQIFSHFSLIFGAEHTSLFHWLWLDCVVYFDYSHLNGLMWTEFQSGWLFF